MLSVARQRRNHVRDALFERRSTTLMRGADSPNVSSKLLASALLMRPRFSSDFWRVTRWNRHNFTTVRNHTVNNNKKRERDSFHQSYFRAFSSVFIKTISTLHGNKRLVSPGKLTTQFLVSLDLQCEFSQTQLKKLQFELFWVWPDQWGERGGATTETGSYS